MTYYIIAGILGMACGALVGVLKYILLWRPLIKGQRELNSKNLALSQIISMITNLVVLFSIYFLRSIWPYSFEVTIICAAVSLALISKITSLQLTKNK